MTKATAEQVRKYYEDQGYEVQIHDGNVIFRKNNGEEWREGRYVSEYRIVDGNVVLV